MVKEKGEYPLGLARTRQGIGHLSHPRLHPHLIPILRRNVSPNPLLGLRTLKGGGFGLTTYKCLSFIQQRSHEILKIKKIIVVDILHCFAELALQCCVGVLKIFLGRIG
jgi:hypothetical protein